MTIDEIESDAKSTVFVVEHYGMDSPSQKRAYDLARAVLAMLPLVREAQLWQRQIIGERTSYDLRLEAVLDDFANAIHDHATSASGGE
jgi:hypothetical protein